MGAAEETARDEDECGRRNEMTWDYMEMTPEEIFEAAGKGREIYNLGPAEDALYARAKLIYTLFRTGELNAESGAERRRVAIQKYKETKQKETFERRWIDYSVEMHKNVEAAAAAYIKEPGYKTADALWNAVTECTAKVKLREAERGDFYGSEMQQLPEGPAGDVPVLEEVGI